ncbi:MAG: hypothetical protein ACPLSM_01235 [Thermosphaera sp.]
MSSAKGSAMRWFEKLLEKTLHRGRSSRADLLRGILQYSINMGDAFFIKLGYVVNKLSIILNKVQITMIESMIMASLWFGLVAILIIWLVTYLA